VKGEHAELGDRRVDREAARKAVMELGSGIIKVEDEEVGLLR
jgi:hypothetical protein